MLFVFLFASFFKFNLEMESLAHTGGIQIQVARTAIGLTRPALWSKLSPLSVCQGFRNLSSWVSEYQRLAGTKSCFRGTGNDCDKESLLMRGTDTDLPNHNQSYVYYGVTIQISWKLSCSCSNVCVHDTQLFPSWFLGSLLSGLFMMLLEL